MLGGEATNTNFIIFGLTRSGLKPTIYCTEANTLTITQPMRFPLGGQNGSHSMQEQWKVQKI